MYFEEQCGGIYNNVFVILEFILLLSQKLLERQLEIQCIHA